MKLLNTTEEIPNEFYVFVNLKSFITKNNYENSKTFNSAAFGELSTSKDFIEKYITGTIDYLPFIPNPNKNLHVMSLFQKSITTDFRVEYNAELARKYNFPIYPSRLSPIYAFGDHESCKKVNQKYEWDLSNVKKFKLNPSPLNRVVKVNMEVISLERYSDGVSFSDPNTINSIWNHYWTGQGNLRIELPTLDAKTQIINSGVLWEYLIEGSIIGIE